MADKAHKETDKKLAEMESELSAIYEQAGKEIEEKAQEYFERFADQDEEKRKLVDQGKMTEEEYRAWRQGKIMRGKRYMELRESIAQDLLNANKTAMAYINDMLPEIYALNYNAIKATAESVVKGYSFMLVNAETVKRLATKHETLLPYKYVNGRKDVRWNTKKVNSAVMQGIVQGDSVQSISKRLQSVTDMNRTSAIRNARTTVTSAECKGRQDSYEQAQKDGIEIEREWIATNDMRTRHAHAFLNGKTAAVDEPFETPLQIGANLFITDRIMYPGDPEAHPANVYNCRCTIAAKVVGFKKVQVQKTMAEKDEYTQAERDEFAALQKKYKNKTEVMLFGTEEEMVRYDYLLQKDKDNAGAFDYYKKFQHQSITEGKLNGWRVEPTTAERDAISSYSRSGYLKMNENLRLGNYAPDSVKREISALHGFLDKCETQDELYLSRGVTKPALDKMFGGDGWRKNSSSLVGSVFTDKGFVSTTPYQGGGFGGDVVMYIKAPKGTKGAYIKDFAASSEEKEFLIQSDTSFVVRNIVEEVDEWGDKKYKVFAEVIV